MCIWCRVLLLLPPHGKTSHCIVNWLKVRLHVFAQFSHCLFPLAVMMTIRLRNCWMEAGLCSGLRWPPAGSVSSSTCGPWSLRWSARSASKPRKKHVSQSVSQARLIVGMWPAEIVTLSQGITTSPHCPPNLETQPYTTFSAKMEDYLLPLISYVSRSCSLFYNVKLLIPWW